MSGTVDQLRSQLAALQLETRGNKAALRHRLRTKGVASAALLQQDPTASGKLRITRRTRPIGEVYDAFLVVDVEATCDQIEGMDSKLAFSYVNEIIEFPIIVLKWRRLDAGVVTEQEEGIEDREKEEWILEPVLEFHSYVKPTFRPILSEFCKNLTGIKQSDVDAAPIYKVVIDKVRAFIKRHSLFTNACKSVFVSDGPWDLRDFVAKACFISRIQRPSFLAGPMIDLRLLSSIYFSTSKTSKQDPAPSQLSIPDVLLALKIAPFQGRLHSGLDDTRNAARILVEYARRGLPLRSNRVVPEGGNERKWGWMGKDGQIDWDRWLEKEIIWAGLPRIK